MNETEQTPAADRTEEEYSVSERECAASEPEKGTTPQQSGSLPKSVVAVVISCLVLNFLMMLTVAVLLVLRLRS